MLKLFLPTFFSSFNNAYIYLLPKCLGCCFPTSYVYIIVLFPPSFLSLHITFPSLAFFLLLSLGCLLSPYFLSQEFLFYFFHLSVLLSFLFWYLCKSRKCFSVSPILPTLLESFKSVTNYLYTLFPAAHWVSSERDRNRLLFMP